MMIKEFSITVSSIPSYIAYILHEFQSTDLIRVTSLHIQYLYFTQS